MALFAFFILVLASSASANPVFDFFLSKRQTDPNQAYFDKVCLPPTPPNATVIPPCISINNIASSCIPNSTDSLGLIAHAECLCSGSFFADQVGCINCGFVHGQRSPKDVSDFATILSSASNALCTGTPTASFPVLFSNIDAGYPHTATNTAKSDQFPSQTDVSLYYTATVSQGPGTITGSATAATKTAGAITSSNGAQTTGTKSVGAVSSSTGATPSSTSTGGAAAPTAAWLGMVGFVAGGVAMAGL